MDSLFIIYMPPRYAEYPPICIVNAVYISSIFQKANSDFLINIIKYDQGKVPKHPHSRLYFFLVLWLYIPFLEYVDILWSHLLPSSKSVQKKGDFSRQSIPQ